MSNLTKVLILVGVILLIGVGLVAWKKKVGGTGHMSFNSISREEVELLLSDVAKTNPMILKRLNEDPAMKKQQIENLKQLLAFASQAQKEGMADDPSNKQELDNIRAEILAVNYDREINKDKGPMPAFGFITEDMTKAYWAEDDQGAPAGPGLFEKIGLTGPKEHRTHSQEFDDFLNTKLAIMKSGNPDMQDREISDEEKTQARDIFAKIRIYKREYDQKLAEGTLSDEFIKKANLQVKLQQAQFLARLYSEKATEQTKVTDEEVDQYIAAHPELSPDAKKATAQGILDRAKNGEDFAALADQYSEDPGNKGPDGKGQGGLYKDVPKGRMVPAFEQAALALEPGQIAADLVQTDFGFHIIKLERKGQSKGADGKMADTYDVRHILISTGVKDPDNPTGRDAPVKDFVRNKLETDKEKKVIDDIVAANNVSVPDDFTVPQVSDEDLQKMQRQRQQPQMMPPGADVPPANTKPGAKPDAKKPDAKKGK